MIGKERIKVGLRFVLDSDPETVYKIIEPPPKIYWEQIKPRRKLGKFETTNWFYDNFCSRATALPETPDEKGKREIAYADKVIEDIEQFELDNIEYLRDKILEKIDRIR